MGWMDGWIYLRSLVLKEHRQSDANKVLIAMFFSLYNIGKHCTTQEASTEIPMLHKLDRDCFLLPSHISVGGFFFWKHSATKTQAVASFLRQVQNKRFLCIY